MTSYAVTSQTPSKVVENLLLFFKIGASGGAVGRSWLVMGLVAFMARLTGTAGDVQKVYRGKVHFSPTAEKV